ncbi:MAG: glycosyltransferase family 61 protein, partial [Paracoccus sp. (in: a-proteobacteria)]
DGIFIPATNKRNWKLNGGVLDSDGSQPVSASCWHYPNAPAAEPREIAGTPYQDLPDPRTAVFLGHYSPMFGHFILESTARLWWLMGPDAKADVSLMLVAQGTDTTIVEAKMREFAALCDIDLPLFAWPERPVAFRKLITPPQGSGALNLMLAAPEYRQMIVGRFAGSVPPQGSPKVYISRSRLPGRHGTLIEEARLEELLSAEGYEIYHPQQHSFQEQIARYKAADTILGLDSSAFHAVALVAASSRKKIGIIQRRTAPEAYLQAEQLRKFDAASVVVVPCEETAWSPAGVRRAALSMFGTLNFQLAGQILKDSGFIADSGPWAATHPTEKLKAVRQVGTLLGADMIEVVRGQRNLSEYPIRAVPGEVSLIRLATGKD